MFDHIALNVSNEKKSVKFYERALGALGYSIVLTFPNWTGFGKRKKPELWLAKRKPASKGAHVALTASSRNAVNAFYKAAIAAGGKDNGKPGVRKDYAPDYYAAFVYDPDGNNIEVVTRKS